MRHARRCAAKLGRTNQAEAVFRRVASNRGGCGGGGGGGRGVGGVGGSALPCGVLVTAAEDGNGGGEVEAVDLQLKVVSGVSINGVRQSNGMTTWGEDDADGSGIGGCGCGGGGGGGGGDDGSDGNNLLGESGEESQLLEIRNGLTQTTQV